MNSDGFELGVRPALLLLQVLHETRFAESAALLGTITLDDDGLTCTGQGFSGDAVDLYARVAGISRDEAETEIEAAIRELPNGIQDLEEPPPPPSLVLDPSAAFPVDALPPPFCHIVGEMARLHGIAPELPGTMVLGLVGACAGKALAMPSIKGLTIASNLYTAAGVPSGFGKSVTAAPLFKPLLEFEDELIRQHSDRRAGDEAKLARVSGELESLLKRQQDGDDSPDCKQKIDELSRESAALEVAIRPPRLIIEDATVEAVSKRLAENGEYLVSLSADAKSVFSNLGGRYRKGGKEDDIYLKGYSGDPFKMDRVGRPPLCLRSPRLGIVWLTQHGSFDNAFSSEALADSGFLPRFLAIRLDARASEEDLDAILASQTKLEYETRLRSAMSAYIRHTGSPYPVSVTPEAVRVMREFYLATKQYMANWSLPAKTITFPQRWAENAYRLELVLHVAEHGGTAHTQPVVEQTARSAVRLMTWFAGQQEKLLIRYLKVAENAKYAVARKFVLSSPAGVFARDLARHSSDLFESSKDAARILDDLVAEGEITSYRGRKSQVYERRRAPGSRP